jgi:hypothetical protein
MWGASIGIKDLKIRLKWLVKSNQSLVHICHQDKMIGNGCDERMCCKRVAPSTVGAWPAMSIGEL